MTLSEHEARFEMRMDLFERRKHVGVFFFIVFSLLIVTFLSSHSLTKGEFSTGLSHCLGIMAFWFTGQLVYYVSRKETWQTLSLSPFLVAIPAQVFAVILLLVFSVLENYQKGLGLIVPVLVALFFVFLFSKARARVVEERSFDWGRLNQSLFILLIVCATVFYFESRELPRIVMLSSDPDIHAFHTRQILRFGQVPWNQGGWGELSLGYPSGFAALAAIWTKLSVQDPRNTVTLLPALQWLMGIAAIIEVLVGKCRNYRRMIVLPFCVILVMAVVLPIGYQKERFHLEGTPRLASFGFICALLLMSFCQKFESLIYQRKASFLGAILFLSSAAMLLLLNPGNIMPVTASFFAIVFSFGAKNFQRYSIIYGFTGFFCIFIFLMDPYYFYYFVNPDLGRTADVTVNSYSKSLTTFLPDWIAEQNLQAFKIGWMKFYPDVFPEIPGQIATCFAVIFIACFAFYLSREIPGGRKLANIVLGCLCSMLFVFPCLRFFAAAKSNFRLLEPYGLTQIQQTLTVLFVFALCLVFVWAQRFRAVVYFVFIASLFGLFRYIKMNNDRMSYALRKDHSGSLGVATVNDLLLAKKVQSLYSETRNDFEGTHGGRVPKILIPNLLLDFGAEKWLFPHGGTRILFSFEVFPLAFYYNQARALYTFDNYKRYICQSFDRAWLLRNDIKYIFFPENYSGCVFGRDRFEKNNKLIFSSGSATFFEISP